MSIEPVSFFNVSSLTIFVSTTPLTLAVDQAKERQNSILVSRRNLIGQSLSAEQEAKGTIYQGEMGAQTALAKGKTAATQSLFSGVSGALAAYNT